MPTTFDGAGPGVASTRPAQWQSGRVMKVVTGKFDFDDSYPTGGEDISDIFNSFTECLGILFEPRGTRQFETDYTNKKVKLFVETAGTLAEAGNATNQSAVTGVRFIAWGYR